jgi:1-deoxy-D-xylulose-5-phosphate synthase
VALHRCGVTFVLDRAGVTGNDGPSHNGMWDLSILQVVPGLRLAAPRDATRLREALSTATGVDDAPTVLRYSKEAVPDDIDAVDCVGGVDVLLRTDQPRVLVVAYGQMAGTGLAVGQRLSDQGIGVTVVDPVWALPVNPALVQLAGEHELVISIEDSGVVGGCGARLAQEMRFADVSTPIREFGIEQRFLQHASRAELLEELGLTPQAIARYAVEAVVRGESTLSENALDQG